MSQSDLPSKKAVWQGLLFIIVPFFVYLLYFSPCESIGEFLYKVSSGWGGEISGLAVILVLIGSFIIGAWMFFSNLFLLLFGNWYNRKRRGERYERFLRNMDNLNKD
jgi:hypothetical protein